MSARQELLDAVLAERYGPPVRQHRPRLAQKGAERGRMRLQQDLDATEHSTEDVA